MSNELPLDDHMQNRISKLYSGENLPSYAGMNEVEAMKARISELEAQLSKREAQENKKVEERTAPRKTQAANAKIVEPTISLISRTSVSGRFPWFVRIWDWLTKASDGLTDISERNSARLAASFLFIISFLTFMGALARIPRLGIFGAFSGMLGYALFATLFAYGFTRTKYYRAGIFVFSMLFGSLAYISMVLEGKQADISVLILLYIPLSLIVASAFLSSWAVFLLTGLNVGAFFLTTRFGIQYVPANFGAQSGIITTIGMVLIALTNFTKQSEKTKLDELKQVNEQLEFSKQNLEQRVSDRTHDLELAAEVGKAVTSNILNLHDLLEEAVELIRARFDLYYVQVYITDQANRTLSLRAGTGEVGRQLLSRGHHLLIGPGSLNGRAALEKNTLIVSNTVENPDFLANPLLPETRSELVVPLTVGDRIMGVLDVQSNEAGKFKSETVDAFEALAGQLAVAIQNAYLFEQAEEARAEVENQAKQQTFTNWLNFLNAVDRNEKFGFIYNQNEVLPYTVSSSEEAEVNALHAPVSVAGAEIGKIYLADEPDRKWTTKEADVIHNTALQLSRHIENLRLLAQSEKFRLEAEQATRRLTFEGWSEFLSTRKDVEGFIYDGNKVEPLNGNGNAKEAPAHVYPILVRDESIGDLAVETPDTSDSDAAEIVAAVTQQLSSHIENLRLLEQTEEQRAQTNKLYDIGQKIAEAKDRQEIVAAVAENIGLPEINRAVLFDYKYDASGELDIITISANWYSGKGTEPSPVGRTYPAKVFTIVNFFKTTEPGLVSNTQSDPRVDQSSKEVFRAQNIHAFASLPLWDGSHQVGTLLLEAEENISFTGKELLPYTSIMHQVTIALQNKNLLEETLQKQEELQQSEERMRILVENAPEAIIIVDLTTGLFVEPNENATKLYGLPREELLKVGPAQMSPPTQPDGRDSTEAAMEKINEAMQGGFPVFEWMHRNGQGKDIPCEVRLVRMPGDKPLVRASVTDITERKKAEEEIRLGRERAQTILESVTLPMTITRLSDNHLTFVNQPALEITQLKYEDVFDKPSPDFYYNPEDRNNFVGTLRSQGWVEDMAVQLKRGDGDPFWALISARLFDYQGEPSIIASFVDITDRINAQQAIAKRATELETVAEVSRTTSTVLDPDKLLQTVVDTTKERFNLYHAHIYLADNAWQTLILASGAGDIGRKMVEENHTIAINAEKSLVARAHREKEPIIVNNVKSQPDFLPNPLLPDTLAEMAVPMIVGDEVLGVFDVQTRQASGFSREDAAIYTTLASQVAVALQNARLYQEQAATVTQLRELDRLKSSFLANMSHELRTPLNSILGFTDVMLEELDGPLTPNMDNDLKLIQKNGQHLLHLINDVLDMAKIESGRMNLNIEECNLHEVMEEVMRITSSIANDKQVALFIEPESDQEVNITADRTRLRQVLINLVNNAIKFTEKGSVSVRAIREANNVLISVKDTGIGIPATHLESIFQEFTQVDTSTTRKAGGTGLGLPISRRLIEMHGGRLWGESSGIEGEGSTFYIFMPLEAKVTQPVEVTSKS